MEINTVMHNSLCISNTVEKHFDLIKKKNSIDSLITMLICNIFWGVNRFIWLKSRLFDLTTFFPLKSEDILTADCFYFPYSTDGLICLRSCRISD